MLRVIKISLISYRIWVIDHKLFEDATYLKERFKGRVRINARRVYTTGKAKYQVLVSCIKLSVCWKENTCRLFTFGLFLFFNNIKCLDLSKTLKSQILLLKEKLTVN